MESKTLKIVGTAVIVIGLIVGAYLAGSLASGDAPAVAKVVPTATAKPSVTATATADTEDKAADGGSQEEQPGPDNGASGSNNSGGSGNGGVLIPVDTTEEPEQPGPVQPQPEITPEPQPDDPTPEPEPANEAPYVISVSPAQGETGVARDVNIVVTFSEEMDKDVAEDAFAVVAPAVDGAFSWDASGTVMTFDPDADFEYGTDVAFKVDSSAADALGLGMDDSFVGSFKVLQQSTVKLYSLAGYDGLVVKPGILDLNGTVQTSGIDMRIGMWRRGYVSFDLGELPEDLVEIQKASFGIYQTGHEAGAYGATTGDLMVRHFTYGTLDMNDYNGGFVCIICGALERLLSGSAADGWKTHGVTDWAQNAWENRDSYDNLFQLRLRFANDHNDGGDIDATFRSGDPGFINQMNRLYVEIIFTHP